MDFKSLMPFGFGGNNDKNPFQELQKEMDKLLEAYSKNFNMPSWVADWPKGARHMMSPNVDISENDKFLVVKAELPGMEAEDIEASIDNNVLTIKGEKKIERREEKENYHLIERSSGSFSRSFPLPFDATPDTLEASFKNGVLTIEIAKPKGEKVAKKHIKIKAEK